MATTDLKDLWQMANDQKPDELATHEDIRKMMEGKTSGVMKKIRNKLMVETLIFLVLTYAFVDLFDALSKGIIIVSFAALLIIVGIVNNITLYQFLKVKIENEDLVSFLSRTIKRLKTQLLFRLGFFAAFIISLLFVLMPDSFSSLFDSSGGMLFLGVTVISVGVKLIVENQIWREHIQNLRESIQQLQED